MRKKLLIGVCMLAVGAFLTDRLLLGSSGAAEAEAAALDQPIERVSPPCGEQPFAQDAGKNVRTAIADRLDRQAAACSDSTVRDAFCAPTSWVAVAKPAAAATTSDEAKARQFAEQHKLTATFVGSDGSRAIVDGRCLLIGQNLDGFTLVSVDRVSCTWSREGVSVRLKLQPAAVDGQ